MNKKSRRSRPFWIALFTIILALSAVALVKTNNFRNPLSLLNLTEDGGEHEGGGFDRGNINSQNVANNADSTGNAAATNSRPQRPEGGGFGEGGGNGSIAWSQIGGVFYNIWLIAAITDVVIIVQLLGGSMIKKIKQLRTPPSAQQPPTPLSVA